MYKKKIFICGISTECCSYSTLIQDENDFEIPEYLLETETKNITSQYESMQQKIDDKIFENKG